MAKPVFPTAPTGPQHSLDLAMTVNGERFALNGVFALEQGMAAFEQWAAKLGNGGLTPEQFTSLLARAEKLAARLEGLDAQS